MGCAELGLGLVSLMIQRGWSGVDITFHLDF